MTKLILNVLLVALYLMSASPVGAVDVAGIDSSKLRINGYPTEAELTADQRRSAEALRTLAKTVPDLPFTPVEVPIRMPDATEIRVSNPAFDSHGNFYVMRSGPSSEANAIIMLDANGNFIRSFAKGIFIYPHSVRVDPAGNVWGVDAHLSVIYKFSPEGKRLAEISVGERPDPSVFNIGTTDITFGRNGHLYVTDGYGNGRILEYSAEGARVRAWGERGSKPGQFVDPHSIATGLDGTIYVADRENGRLQWFGPDGRYLGEKFFGGWVISVRVAPNTGDVYVATLARGPDPVKDYERYVNSAYIFKFDPTSGKVLGKINYIAHQFDISQDGSLVVGSPRQAPGAKASSTLLVFRPQKRN